MNKAALIAKAANDEIIKEVARSLLLNNVEKKSTRNLNSKIYDMTSMDAETFKDSNQDPAFYTKKATQNSSSIVVSKL